VLQTINSVFLDQYLKNERDKAWEVIIERKKKIEQKVSKKLLPILQISIKYVTFEP
jgi:hypothetical protein